MYARNQELDNDVKFLKREVEKYKDAAMYVFVTLIWNISLSCHEFLKKNTVTLQKLKFNSP